MLCIAVAIVENCMHVQACHTEQICISCLHANYCYASLEMTYCISTHLSWDTILIQSMKMDECINEQVSEQTKE